MASPSALELPNLLPSEPEHPSRNQAGVVYDFIPNTETLDRFREYKTQEPKHTKATTNLFGVSAAPTKGHGPPRRTLTLGLGPRARCGSPSRGSLNKVGSQAALLQLQRTSAGHVGTRPLPRPLPCRAVPRVNLVAVRGPPGAVTWLLTTRAVCSRGHASFPKLVWDG